MQKRVCIIGAGLTGSIISSLLPASLSVTLVDKARESGGRMTTRNGGDLGAQYLTVKSDENQYMYDRLEVTFTTMLSL